MPCLNARSLKSQHVSNGRKLCHLSRFQELVYSEPVDLVWVTETWLTKDIANTEILHDDYAIYRKDREPRTGGGVMVAVKGAVSHFTHILFLYCLAILRISYRFSLIKAHKLHYFYLLVYSRDNRCAAKPLQFQRLHPASIFAFSML